MRISLPVSFWTLLVSNLSYSDAFTPPNLQDIFRTPRSPSGTIHDDTNQQDYINDNHDAASDSRGLGKRTQFLQRLWAKTGESPEIMPRDSNNSNDNSPDEHQIRAAYLQWCEKYKKQADTTRYPQFVNNYKVMRSIAKTGGKAMHLNEFADFTGEEYQLMMKEKNKGATQPLTTETVKQVIKRVPAKAQIQRNEAIGREESLTTTTTLVEAKSMSSERQQQERVRNIEPQPQSQSQKTQDSIPITTKDYSVNSAISDPSKSTKLINDSVGNDELRSMLSSTTETSVSKDKPKLMNKDAVRGNKAEGNLKTDDKKMKVDTDNIASSASTNEKIKKQEQTKHHQQSNLTKVKPSSSSSSSSSYKPIASGYSKDRSVKENVVKRTTTSTIVSSSSSTSPSSSSPPNPKLPMKDSYENKAAAISRSDSSSTATTSQSLTNRKEKRNSDDLSSSKRKVLSSFDLMKEKYTKKFSTKTIDKVEGKKNITDGGPAKADKEEQRRIEGGAKAKADALADSKADEDERTRIRAEKQRQEEEEKEQMEVEAKAKADALAGAQADEEQQTRIQAEKQRQVEEEMKQLEAQAKAKADALVAEEEQARVQAEKQRQVEEKKRMETEAKAKADALAKTKAAEEEQARVQAEKQRQVEEKKRMEVEAKTKADALAKTKAAEQEQVRVQAEKQRQVEEKKRIETEAKTKADALARTKAAEEEQVRVQAEKQRQVEEKKRKDAEAKTKADALAKTKAVEEEQKKIQAEKQRQAEEKRMRIQAEETAKALALAKAAEEEQKRIKVEKERQVEEERKRIQVEAKAKFEEERRRQIEAEKKSKLEEEKRRLQIEAEEKAKMEEEVEQQRIQADARAKVEKERRQQIEAEKKTALEKERRRRQIEIENKAKAEEDQKRIQIKERAKAKERRRLEDEKKAKLEEEQQIKAKAKAEAERKRRVEAEKERKRIYAEARAKVEEERRRKIDDKKAKLEEEKRRRQIVEAKKKVKAEKERKQIQAEARAKVEEERRQKKKKLEEEELIKAELKIKATEERMRCLEAESRAKAEEEKEQERIHAEARAKVEEERRRRIQAEEKAKLEEEKYRLQIVEAEEKAKLEKENRKQQIVETEKEKKWEEEQEQAKARIKIEEERSRRQKKIEAEKKSEIEEQSRRQTEIDKKAEENRIQVVARAKVEEERVRRKLLVARLKEQKEALKKDEIEAKMKIEEETRRVEAAAKNGIEEERRRVEAEAKKKIELAIAQEMLAKKLVEEEDSKEKAKAEEAVAAAVEAKEKEEGEELRIRGAYLDWCLEFSKKPDKVRIEQFKNNYLLLEGVAEEEGKDIKLNEYADFTAAEFENEIQRKQEAKGKEEQERLRKEQEEVETAFAAAGGDVGVINKETDGTSSDEIKVEDELFQVQDEDGNDIGVEKGEDDVLHETKGKTVDTEDEWWKKEEGLDESMLQTDDSNSIWSGAKRREDMNQSTFMSKSPHTAASDSSENNDHEPTTNADDPEVRKRVRAAYSNWCRTYHKEPDEGRFPKFKSNYVIMEKLANEQGREVTLNEFADCTPDEYEKASRGKSTGRNDTGAQRLRKLRIEQEVKTSRVEPRRVVHTTRNIDINQEAVVDEEHDEAAANAEVEKIALAKADEAAKRVEEIRKGKMKHGKANDESERRVKVQRQNTKPEEAATAEAQRIANAKAKAKKSEEERLRREWQEARAESRKAVAEQERMRNQEQNKTNKILELEAKKNYFEDRQRNGRKATFSRTETSRSKDDNDDKGASRSNLSPDEETQPVVKPPSSKPKKSFQPRPTFASSLKNSMRSNTNEEGGFGGDRSSWRDQDGQEIVDDVTNGIPSTSDSKYIPPNDDFMAPPPDIEETTREAFNDRSFFPNVDQTSSSNASPSVQKPASSTQSNSYDDSYFMDVPPTNDEELLDSSLSSNQDIYSERWSSPSHDPPKQPRPTLLDPASEYSNNGDTWYSNGDGDGDGEISSEISPSVSVEPSIESYSRRGPLLNKGASYLENLSKGDASSSADGINTENSYSNDHLSRKQYSQQQGSSKSAFPERIQAAYRDWCQYYGNVYSEDRLRTFSANFLAVEKYHRETGVSLILNELADMTSEEFQKRKM